MMSFEKIFIFIISTFIAINSMAEKLIANWPLNGGDNAKVIVDSTGKYNLTEQVSKQKGVWSGFSKKYISSFDMRNKAWTLKGSFQTTVKQSGTFVIAGTRNAMSRYTGWDFIMINGMLRVVAFASDGRSATLMCSRRFNDAKMHNFSLSWDPNDGARGRISLKMDGKYRYQALGAGDLKENTRRYFAIGCQALKNRKKLIWKGGSLKSFKFFEGNEEDSNIDIGKLDPSMKAQKKLSGDIKWYDASKLLIEGKGWKKTAAPYGRLPLKFRSVVRPAVWSLSCHSAGIAVRFTATNTSFINARWTVKDKRYMAHMTALGVSGLDLYVKLNNKWHWLGVGKPSEFKDNELRIASRIPKNKKLEYLLYLPLYNIITNLKLGFSPGVKIEPTLERGKPLVVYGTSIVHGCSASRPGMNWPAILGRKFDLPVVNLGFSGNGTMDPEFADILAEIPASAYLIDCLPNMAGMKPQRVCNRTVVLVKKLRKKRPHTPIILIEDRTYGHPNFSNRKVINNGRIGLKKAYQQLSKNKIGKLYYIEGNALIGYDSDATVDGSHPSDLGMYRYSQVIGKTLRKILSN